MKILFFGILSEIAKANELQINDFGTLNEVKEYLFQNYPDLSNKTFQFAVNQRITNNNIVLKPSDVIACLPPFAGG